MQKARQLPKPYLKPVKLYIIFQTNDKRHWDIDNRVKVIQDCLQLAEIIKDDTQVDFLCVERQREHVKIQTLLNVKTIEE